MGLVVVSLFWGGHSRLYAAHSFGPALIESRTPQLDHWHPDGISFACLTRPRNVSIRHDKETDSPLQPLLSHKFAHFCLSFSEVSAHHLWVGAMFPKRPASTGHSETEFVVSTRQRRSSDAADFDFVSGDNKRHQTSNPTRKRTPLCVVRISHLERSIFN